MEKHILIILNGVCHNELSISRAGCNYIEQEMHFRIGADISERALMFKINSNGQIFRSQRFTGPKS